MRLLKQLWIVIGAVVAAFLVSWVLYMPDANERGVWRSQTGGQIITLSPLKAQLYSESSASCVHQLTFPAHMKLVEMAEGATVQVVGEALHLLADGTLEPILFDRIAALPDTCGAFNPNAPALDVFNAMWAAMDEHYAFFSLHNVDWDARRDFAPTGAPTLTNEDLFALLSETLTGLDDGHVQLVSPFDGFSPAVRPSWLPEGDTQVRETLTQIARDTVGPALTPVELTGVEFTLMPDGVAYVLIRHMGLNAPFGTTEQAAMATAFADVAAEIETANAIIIDIRYNPGGSDSVSFGVASHFTGQPVDVLTKTTRNGDGQTEPFTATLQPYDPTPLTQPVILLTSELTGSAAEILTMAMRELPQVTTMGHPTSGGLSDILGFTLPNGWELGLSHQTYRTMDGGLYEGVGIPPDVAFEIETAPLLQGEDPLLRAAFQRARGQLN
ncbi:S41 family peptidase [Octadecabacter sp. CECT 8868]|uniref:S41 family peptidase n=1 Tax=Octadecabacter algicola TaxID=2909342 RepID=UPI001F1A2204|nr:S41 family peptidase [Octadecabacter algicola]MCF2903723.1 S41 family peptidase [Octadecabacter algicola]